MAVTTASVAFSVQVMFEGEKNRSQIEAGRIPDDVVELVTRALEEFVAKNGALVQKFTKVVGKFVINGEGELGLGVEV